jgi:cyclohexa-1,5-dienecarbonyl-CoA hydratase
VANKAFPFKLSSRAEPFRAESRDLRFTSKRMTIAANTTTFTRIAVELRPPAARVTLNNPPLNVIDIPMMEELRAALEQIEIRPEISALVIAGSESAFSGGVDIAAHTPDNVRGMLADFHSVIRSVVSSSKLTIASVRRHCLGGGAELALMCDVIYASPDSVWGFPEIKLACYAPVASVALSSIVGQKLAAELLLTGRTLSGEEALAARLVNGLADDPETLVTECIQRVSQLSPAALRLAKKAFYAWDSIHFDKGLMRAEQIYTDELMKTVDAQEGIAAFIERRRPNWSGR